MSTTRPLAHGQFHPRPAADIPDVDTGFPTNRELANGVRILAAPGSSALVATAGIVLSVGSRDEEPAYNGVTHLLEHLLMTSAVGGGASFVEVADRLGAEANAVTTKEQLLLYVRHRPQVVRELLPLLCEVACGLSLTDDDLARERSVVLRELAESDADADERIKESTYRALFPGTPLELPVAGTVPSLTRVRLRHVREHIDDSLRTWPVAVVLVGLGEMPPPDVLAATSLATRRRTPDAIGRRPALAPVGAAGLLPVVASAAPGGRLHRVAYVARTGGHTGDIRARATAEVLLHCLVGGHRSLVNDALRNDRRLAYGATGWTTPLSDAGILRVTASVDGERVDEFAATVATALARLAAGDYDPERLVEARRQAEGEWVRDGEDGVLSFMRYARFLWDDGGRWSPDRELAAIEAVQATEVADLAAAVLRSGTTVAEAV